MGYCLNISGTLGGNSECDSNKIVRSLSRGVVVEVVADVVVVVNVVVGGTVVFARILVFVSGGWLGMDKLIYKTGETVVVTAAAVSVVVMVVVLLLVVVLVMLAVMFVMVVVVVVVAVVVVAVLVVLAVLELGLLEMAAGDAAVVLFNLSLGMTGEVGCRTLDRDIWAGVVVVMGVLGGVNFPALVLFL